MKSFSILDYSQNLQLILPRNSTWFSTENLSQFDNYGPTVIKLCASPWFSLGLLSRNCSWGFMTAAHIKMHKLYNIVKPESGVIINAEQYY